MSHATPREKILDEALLRRAHGHAAAYLQSMPDRHVGAQATRDELLTALRTPLGANGDDPAAVLDALASQGERGTMASAGPRYFGFVIGGSLPVALAADWLIRIPASTRRRRSCRSSKTSRANGCSSSSTSRVRRASAS